MAWEPGPNLTNPGTSDARRDLSILAKRRPGLEQTPPAKALGGLHELGVRAQQPRVPGGRRRREPGAAARRGRASRESPGARALPRPPAPPRAPAPGGRRAGREERQAPPQPASGRPRCEVIKRRAPSAERSGCHRRPAFGSCSGRDGRCAPSSPRRRGPPAGPPSSARSPGPGGRGMGQGRRASRLPAGP